MTKKIIVYYFPAGMRYASWLCPVVTIWLVLNGYYLWSAFFMLTFAVIMSTKYVTIIDTGNKIFRDYIFFLGFRLGNEKQHYQTIHGITIGRSSETQNVRSRVQDRQFSWTAYTATLHFDHDQSLDLITSVSLEAVKNEAKMYAEFLGTQILV